MEESLEKSGPDASSDVEDDWNIISVDTSLTPTSVISDKNMAGKSYGGLFSWLGFRSNKDGSSDGSSDQLPSKKEEVPFEDEKYVPPPAKSSKMAKVEFTPERIKKMTEDQKEERQIEKQKMVKPRATASLVELFKKKEDAAKPPELSHCTEEELRFVEKLRAKSEQSQSLKSVLTEYQLLRRVVGAALVTSSASEGNLPKKVDISHDIGLLDKLRLPRSFLRKTRDRKNRDFLTDIIETAERRQEVSKLEQTSDDDSFYTSTPEDKEESGIDSSRIVMPSRIIALRRELSSRKLEETVDSTDRGFSSMAGEPSDSKIVAKSKGRKLERKQQKEKKKAERKSASKTKKKEKERSSPKKDKKDRKSLKSKVNEMGRTLFHRKGHRDSKSDDVSGTITEEPNEAGTEDLQQALSSMRLREGTSEGSED